MMIHFVFVHAHSRTRQRRGDVNGQNVRSPKLRSPKELSPGIPRRPTAPRERCANVPDAGSSRCGTGTPRSTAEHRMPRSRGNTPLQAPCQQQRNGVERQQGAADRYTANHHGVALRSEKFAQSQLQVNSNWYTVIVILLY